MKQTQYIVVEEGWDYNDEYYNKSESNSYTIHGRLHQTKEAAQDEANDLNNQLKQQHQENPNDYYFTDDEGTPILPYKVIPIETN
jgi:hypothetical protein